eukprot:3112800-Amphidinium_carterae.1
MHTWRNLACVLVGMIGKRTIQEKKKVQPLRLAHTPLRGRNNKKYNFDMVAELAIELARIFVTHA